MLKVTTAVALHGNALIAQAPVRHPLRRTQELTTITKDCISVKFAVRGAVSLISLVRLR
jgi:hypothetical protein